MILKYCFYGNLYSSFLGNNRGGGELQTAIIAKYLEGKGNVVTIIDFSISENQKIGNIQFLSCPFNKSIGLIRFIKILFSINCDVYYIRIRDWKHILSAIIAKLRRKKIVLGIAHDLDLSSFSERIRFFYNDNNRGIKYFIKNGILTELLFPLTLKIVDLIITQHSNQFNSKKIKARNKVVINNILEMDNNFNSNSIELKYDFIFIGQLDVRKGIEYLRETIKSLPNKYFIIIGKVRNNKKQNDALFFLKQPNVVYFDQVAHNEVYRFIMQSKALISTSNAEGFPNVFLEAWKCCRQVISLKVNPGNLFNINSQLGICFNGDLKKFISYLENYVFDYDANNIIYYLKEHHSVEKNMFKFEKEIKKLYDS